MHGPKPKRFQRFSPNGTDPGLWHLEPLFPEASAASHGPSQIINESITLAAGPTAAHLLPRLINTLTGDGGALPGPESRESEHLPAHHFRGILERPARGEPGLRVFPAVSPTQKPILMQRRRSRSLTFPKGDGKCWGSKEGLTPFPRPLCPQRAPHFPPPRGDVLTTPPVLPAVWEARLQGQASERFSPRDRTPWISWGAVLVPTCL